MKEEHKILLQIRNAQKDTQAADALIAQYMPFIKSETASFLKRAPIEGQDDELCIAMFAFYEAVMSYRSEKGTFLSLAAAAIRNRLIDQYRKEKRHTSNISLEASQNQEDDSCSLLEQLADKKDEINTLQNRAATKAEIEEFSRQLTAFGLSLSDIADSCPRQERTKTICLTVLDYAKEHPLLLEEMVRTRKLPLQTLCRETGMERKTLERHRKYLIAILLAFTNGYEIIRGHIRHMKRKEEKQ